MFTTILAFITTTSVEQVATDGPTMFSTTLAITTTTTSLDATAVGFERSDGSSVFADLKKLTDVSTLFTTTLASSTATDVDEEKIMDFVSRVFDNQSHQHAEICYGQDGPSASIS